MQETLLHQNCWRLAFFIAGEDKGSQDLQNNLSRGEEVVIKTGFTHDLRVLGFSPALTSLLSGKSASCSLSVSLAHSLSKK